jgi:hypothetical protein
LGPKGPIPGLGWGREEAGEGAPVAKRSGRRGLCAGEAGAAPTTWGRLGARVGAREGEGSLG